MKKIDDTKTVDDTRENLEICNCAVCPTFKDNKLSEYPPNTLFCARRKSSIPSKVKTTSCYCPACDVFTKYKLIIGHFCVNK